MAKPASGATLDSLHALATNLVACWPMIDGTGTTASDLTANDNHLTLDASVTWGSDDFTESAIAMGSAVASPATPATPIVFDGSASWSIAWRASQNASNNFGMVFGDNTDTVDYVHFSGGVRLRYRNSGTLTIDFALTSFTADDDYVLTYEHSTGTTGTYRLYVNASLIATSSSKDGSFTLNTVGNGYASNTFSLVGTISYLYVWSGRVLSLSESGDLNTDPYAFLVPAATDSVSLFTLSRVWQRTGANVNVPVSGSYNGGTADAVQARVLLASDNSEVVAWADVDSTLSSNTWSGSVVVPNGGPYYLQVRLLDASDSILATAADSATFLVGDVFLVTGQSNAIGRGTNVQTYSGTRTAWMIDESGDIANLANPWSDNNDAGDGSFGPLLANLIDAAEGVPTIWIVNGKGATAIAIWGSGALRRTSIASQVSLLNPNAIKAVLWIQGESDALAPTSYATYLAAESDFASYVNSLPGSPQLISTLLGEVTGVVAAELDAIQLAKKDNWAATATLAGPNPTAIDLTVDSLHYRTDIELARFAALWWFAIDDHVYAGTNGRGPRVASVTSTGSNTLVVTFDRDLDASDTSYTTAAWSVDNDDGPVRTVSSVSRTGTRTVEIVASGNLDGTSPKITFSSGNSGAGATSPKTTAISLPATINGLSAQPLYAEPFYDYPVAIVSVMPKFVHHYSQQGCC